MSGYISGPLGPMVTRIAPEVVANGKITTIVSMSDGTTVSGSSVNSVGGVNIFSYDPTTYALVNGSTIQLNNGYAYYYFSGTGLLVSAIVKLPTAPVDGQTARLIFPSGLTITTLSVQNAAGTVIGSYATVLLGSSPIFQYRPSISGWTQVGRA